MKGFFAFILQILRYAMSTSRNRKTALTFWRLLMKKPVWPECVILPKLPPCAPDCAIIGEPTSLQPVRAHKGHISNAIRIQGQSGTPAIQHAGVNAIQLMHDAIGHILQLRDNLKERYHYERLPCHTLMLNLGIFTVGDASNRICACCELHMDICPSAPGMTLNELNGLLNDALRPPVSERWLVRPDGRTKLHPPIPGNECPPNHQLVEVVEKLLGAKTEVVNDCTEVPLIQTLCPTLVSGPGSINQAHQPDEYLEDGLIKPTLRTDNPGNSPFLLALKRRPDKALALHPALLPTPAP